MQKSNSIFYIFLETFKYFSGFPLTIGTTAVPGGQSTGSVTGDSERYPPFSLSQCEWDVLGGCFMVGILLFYYFLNDMVIEKV